MNIHAKCFANLAENDSCNFHDATSYEINDGNRVKDLIDTIDLPADDVSLVFVNGKKASVNAVLSDGDQVGLFPPVGGM